MADLAAKFSLANDCMLFVDELSLKNLPAAILDRVLAAVKLQLNYVFPITTNIEFKLKYE